ncbi:hypothetical protein AYI69_g3290 [Smittium culicis]|uniref:Uncharacterized protein n=1 Tax=Smittium culicis TaxID=133412 RepID=A0A1R1YK82_9FUNG|nr:hypothetical protein AYI69_g8774 [Smittium culicis]OMJ27280.1 hypothetical protein AYI69_g3290 [Smittium culicis]
MTYESMNKDSGIVYSGSRLISLPFASGQYIFNKLARNTPLGCITSKTFLKDFEIPPVSNTQVAKAVVHAIEAPEISGVFSCDSINEF